MTAKTGFIMLEVLINETVVLSSVYSAYNCSQTISLLLASFAFPEIKDGYQDACRNEVYSAIDLCLGRKGCGVAI